MEYTTIAQIDSRLAQLQEDWELWIEMMGELDVRTPLREITDELDIINAEMAQLNELRREIVLTEGLQRAVDNFCGAVNEAVEETIQEEQTIEVVALPASDDWLDEELDAMIADPAGTRFLNENAPETAENSQETSEVTRDVFVPYFASYAHFVLWVIGQAVRGITYIRRIANELSTSTSSVGYAA